jgi:hypothetical protein
LKANFVQKEKKRKEKKRKEKKNTQQLALNHTSADL